MSLWDFFDKVQLDTHAIKYTIETSIYYYFI